MPESNPQDDDQSFPVRDYERLLQRVLMAMYPDAQKREHVESQLQRYGTEIYQREPARVRLVSDQPYDEKQLEGLIDLACDDYRDLLVEAQYPLSATKYDLRKTDPDQYRNLQAKEKRDYDDWLNQILGEEIG
ncbi:MAG: hypothetical protein AAF911_04575 [Planctomycetota bacterium]